MYRSNLFDNPFIIFLLFIIVSITNVLFTVHFIAIFLIGVLFMAFVRCLEKGYTYSMILILFTFTIVETSHGLKFLSLSLVAFFIYFFIVPKIKAAFSSQTFYFLLLILFFYICVGILFYMSGGIDAKLSAILMTNYFIDLLIVSLIL